VFASATNTASRTLSKTPPMPRSWGRAGNLASCGLDYR
jgi:hypothetical protein